MKRSLGVASAAALTLVPIAAAPATLASSGGTVYVCDGSGWQTLAHS
jgi:hypothetical protein